VTNISVGPFQVPIRWIRKAITALLRHPMGIPGIERRPDRLEQHLGAMTEILQILVADVSGHWSPDHQERVQRQIANFTLVDQGLARQRPRGNPLSAGEISSLRELVRRAEQGGTFTPAEGWEFRRLSELVSRERPGEEWVKDLLKLALFIFGVYVLSETLKPRPEP